MNNALKGALLSGLVFPGLGQIILKHYARGIIFMLALFVGMVVLVTEAVRQGLTIIGNMASEGGIITTDTISIAAQQASATSGNLKLNLALLWILACWIIATIDAYRIGKKHSGENKQ